MIVERVMGMGSWQVQLSPDAPLSLYNSLTKLGHLVVTPQRLEPAVIGDAGMLAAARYAGPLMKRRISERGLELEGHGMAWWLGDPEGRGSGVYETTKALSAATLSTCLTTLLPSAVTSGTVTNGSLPTYTGEFVLVTPLDAIRTVMVALGAEFRINPDGTMDAGASDDVFTFDTPVVVVLRKGWGADATYKSVFARTLASTIDATDFVTRAILVHETSAGAKSVADSSTRAGVTAYDIHGNLVTRTRVEAAEADASTSTATYLSSILDKHDEIRTHEVDADQWEVTGGSWQVGDAFWVYDPPGFVDTANQIHYRGDVLNPVKMRLIEAAWPLRDGMGVFYRPATSTVAAADWVDLSDVVQWEDGRSQVSAAQVV